MERVARNRHIKPASCMMSLTSARRISGTQWAWVLGLRTNVLLRCLVVDLPKDTDSDGDGLTDREELQGRRIVVELKHESAKLICGSVVDPPRACPVLVKLITRSSANEDSKDIYARMLLNNVQYSSGIVPVHHLGLSHNDTLRSGRPLFGGPSDRIVGEPSIRVGWKEGGPVYTGPPSRRPYVPSLAHSG